MGAMMEREGMTITIHIEGHPQNLQDWYEQLNAEIVELHEECPGVFLCGVSRQEIEIGK